MNPEEVINFLVQRQVKFQQQTVQSGVQIRCSTGEIFVVYDTGKVVIQGKNTALTEAVRGWIETGATTPVATDVPATSPTPAPNVGPDRRVFVVYGHDTAARDSLELLLRRMKLEPIVLQNLPASGDTIIEKLEKYLGEQENVGFACVLLTPDDEGHRAGAPEEIKYRARQNVILELGMVLARLGRRRVAILNKESVEEPSDIAGLIYVAFKERVDEVKFQLVKELQAAGYAPHTESL